MILNKCLLLAYRSDIDEALIMYCLQSLPAQMGPFSYQKPSDALEKPWLIFCLVIFLGGKFSEKHERQHHRKWLSTIKVLYRYSYHVNQHFMWKKDCEQVNCLNFWWFLLVLIFIGDKITFTYHSKLVPWNVSNLQTTGLPLDESHLAVNETPRHGGTITWQSSEVTFEKGPSGFAIWVFPNGWFIMENPIKMGWFWGTIIFGNTHMSPFLRVFNYHLWRPKKEGHFSRFRWCLRGGQIANHLGSTWWVFWVIWPDVLFFFFKGWFDLFMQKRLPNKIIFFEGEM